MTNYNLNPIIFGLIAGIATYIMLYLDVNYENKKLKIKLKVNKEGKCKCPSLYVSLKVPLILGAVVWGAASYFSNNTNSIEKTFFSDTSSLFEQDLFTDQPDF